NLDQRNAGALPSWRRPQLAPAPRTKEERSPPTQSGKTTSSAAPRAGPQTRCRLYAGVPPDVGRGNTGKPATVNHMCRKSLPSNQSTVERLPIAKYFVPEGDD